jgi:carboxypeptidase Taq
MPAAPASYAELCQRLKSVKTLESIGSLLSWDQETYMPDAGAAHRAEQASMVSALAHERFTDRTIGDLIAACVSDKSLNGDAGSPEAANLKQIKRDYDLATKLPTELVAELAKTRSQAQEAWKHAREKNDFQAFAPWLEKMMGLTKRKAECYGFASGGELYDALLDEYEPGATAREVEGIFTPLAPRLSALVKAIGASSKKPSDACMKVHIPAAKQHELGQFVLKAMGFDFEAGRLDTTAHPFCSGMAPGDTRLTTRYRESSWADALYGTMHEGGHGLYEQGLPKTSRWGQPLGDSVSLGIHESQSRMWENFVGRSEAFWAWLTPHAKKIAVPALDGVSAEEMYGAANVVRPSLIRVEADEATYNLHVLVRFEIERALISGSLPVKDVPGEWNKRYKQYLGVDVPSDAKGCMQDVHWSCGLVGYFPTYTLGNLYAAQLWETIQKQIPNLNAQMGAGEFGALKTWLNTNIHQHGRRYQAAELCRRLTGQGLSADPLMRHLEGKLRPIYGL